LARPAFPLYVCRTETCHGNSHIIILLRLF
jgi:hypothetical protein